MEQNVRTRSSSRMTGKSQYFSSKSGLNNKPKKKHHTTEKKKTQTSSSQNIAEIPEELPSPVHKRKRTKKVDNPSHTIESVSVNGPPLASELTCGHNRVRDEFYDVPCIDLAKKLLGHVLVRQLEDGTILKGRIVETECYLGGEDKASQSYNGKITERNTPMYMKPGTSYVYLTYGMYHCFNISSQGPGAAVLLRAVDPLHGADVMFIQRRDWRKPSPNQETTSSNQAKMLQTHELCNGPSKLCISFTIDKHTCNKQDLSSWDGMWIEESEDDFVVNEQHIVTSHRIGIESAGSEWATKPLRFYLMNNRSVSKRDKVKENELNEAVQLPT